jgi:5-methylcytosine-specific restriction endonuclease McrA
MANSRKQFETEMTKRYKSMYLDRESAIARATIDHVIPLCRGGTNDDENRKAAHRGCNVWKRDALLEELPDLF